MIEPIDVVTKDIRSKSERKMGPFNILSIVLLCVSIGIIGYTILLLRYEITHPVSPWLPEYTPFVIHSPLINFAIIQFLGFLPSVYLRWKKKYALSSYFMIAFLVLARLFESRFEFYKEVFYMLH